MKRFPALSCHVGLAALVAVLSTGAFAFQEQEMNRIQIDISGTPGTEFSMHWRVSDGGDVTEYREERLGVPAQFHYAGTALVGQVTLLTDDGRLEVDVQKDGNRTRSSTQGKGSTLNLTLR